jgi:hypothetical protein
METEMKKKRDRHPDRIGLHPESMERLDKFRDELKQHIKGVTLSRAEIANALLLFHPPSLSAEEIDRLREKYFDEVKYAQWVLRQMKEAKARGDNVSLSQFFSSSHS